MQVTARCLLRSGSAALLAALLAGCPVRPPPPAPPPPAAPAPAALPHLGTPYDIASEESLLIVLVYRAGALAGAGHNHVIASHALAGSFYVPEDIEHTSFEVHVPVAALTVDEGALRLREASADFPPDVPEGARQGTRRNMLSEALLDAGQHPAIVLRALGFESRPPPADSAAAGANTVLARVETTVRGQVRNVTVPVSYQLDGNMLRVSAEFALRQSDLGLMPFTALLGALAVQDEMRVRISIVARAGRARAATGG